MTDEAGVAILAAIQALSSDMLGMKADIAGLKADGAELKSDMFVVKREIAVLRSDIISVRTDVMSRMDRLQDDHAAVTDDITVNFAAAMKSDRVAKNTLEETRALADEVTAPRAQVRRISTKVFGSGELH